MSVPLFLLMFHSTSSNLALGPSLLVHNVPGLGLVSDLGPCHMADVVRLFGATRLLRMVPLLRIAVVVVASSASAVALDSHWDQLQMVSQRRVDICHMVAASMASIPRWETSGSLLVLELSQQVSLQQILVLL